MKIMKIKGRAGKKGGGAMKVLTMVFVVLSVAILCVDSSYAARGGNGKGKSKDKSVSQQKDKSTGQEKRAYASEKSRNDASQRKNKPGGENPGNSGVKDEKLTKINNERDPERLRGKSGEAKDKKGDLFAALDKARWAHNPHDTRGQGNMGKPDMLDPFGHDKDSDRKEIYGNNGRPIRTKDKDRQEAIEVPILEDTELPAEGTELPVAEELPVLDASIDFSSIDSMEWLVNWYESVVRSYYTNDSIAERYTYEQWDSMWYNHFFPSGDRTSTGIRLNNIGDTSERYHYDINLNNFEGDSVVVTTTMKLSEGYTGYTWYRDENGSYKYEITEHQAGEVVYEQSADMGIDSATGAVAVGIAATDDLIDYSSNEIYVDMEVTVTDPTTGATYTQTYDKSLYLYRCPYGKVTSSKTSEPIVGAKVTAYFEDGAIVSLDKATNSNATNPQVTDATGRYGFKLETNRKYYMVVSADGYEDYKSPVFTEKWHVLREDISLTQVD